MADELDALLERVLDVCLRSELKDHVDRLRRRRDFGLVYESHLPERVRLPDHPIRRRSRVVRRSAPPAELPREKGGFCRSLPLASVGRRSFKSPYLSRRP